ncbi:urea amidolyase associated protein UAAP1 [Pseudoxanthomonas suwonensis]|uniref:Urea carboxylase n=1 Tax=Pseudoxanthomonas suwonensis TaxID=314722 RepID=A0A0E3Z0B0_9GAMM|nr:urea amidolyase associated protein UAAP1 [Pseudoxanthomonas suwonensis]AKC86407.1 urea carboxylase [Pseudoxanthomonas suwonensis]
MTDQPLHRDVLAAGCHWSLEVRRGHVLRLVDVEGGANLGLLLYNPRNPLERLNLPDTLKCQHTFRLGKGHCLYSDMGRVFCSIIEDTAGWHDAACGASSRALVERRWGRLDYQAARNGMHRSGIDGFLVELGKHGLGRRDLAANVNFFSKVVADADGALRFVPGASPPGARVDLRFEMDALVVMTGAPHPLDPAGRWPARPVAWEIHPAAPPGADDACRDSRAENQRGFRNNDLYHRGCACGEAA